MSAVSVSGLSKSFGHLQRAQGHRSADRGRRLHRAARPVRLRQVHAAECHRRPGGHRCRHHRDRRRRRDPSRTQQARHRDGVPVLRAVSDDVGAQEPVVRPAGPVGAAAGGGAPGRLGGQAAADRRVARPQAVAAFRRPAPARRDRSRAGAARQGVSVRRAAVQPRRQAAHRDARRAQAPAQGTRRHDRLCDARPDRGDDPGDAHRGHARRPDRAIRRAG